MLVALKINLCYETDDGVETLWEFEHNELYMIRSSPLLHMH